MRSALISLLFVAIARAATVSVMSYGAHADGVTNDASAFQAAINAQRDAGGGTVTCPDGSYAIATPIYLQSGVTLSGGAGCNLVLAFAAGGGFETRVGIWFANGAASTIYPDAPAKNGLGDEYPTTLIGLNAASAGDRTITCSTPGCFGTSVVGDWLVLAAGASPKWDTWRWYVQITAISGDTVTLDRALDWGWPIDGLTSGFFRIQPVVNAHLVGLTITPTSAYTSYPINTSYAFNSSVENITIATGASDFQFYANNTDHFTVSGISMARGLFSGFNYSQYGLAEHNTYAAVGTASCEGGQGERYTIYRYNTVIGATGGNSLFGFGGARDITLQYNTINSPSRSNYLIAFLNGSNLTASDNRLVGTYGIKVCGDCGTLSGVTLARNRIMATNTAITTQNVSAAVYTLTNNLLNPRMGGHW